MIVMKLKIVLIEEEDKEGDERLHPSLTEGALTIQMHLLLGALKDIGFIRKYEFVEGKQKEIHVYPAKIKHAEFVAERISSAILSRNRMVRYIKNERKTRLRILIKAANPK